MLVNLISARTVGWRVHHGGGHQGNFIKMRIYRTVEMALSASNPSRQSWFKIKTNQEQAESKARAYKLNVPM